MFQIAGGFQNIQPSITQDGNIFYDISLPDLIPIEVNLYILYQPQNDLPRPILIDDGFVNVSNIVYLERDPPAEIMNTGFSLRVALAARTPDLVMGPLSNTSPILGRLSHKLFCTCNYSKLLLLLNLQVRVARGCPHM